MRAAPFGLLVIALMLAGCFAGTGTGDPNASPGASDPATQVPALVGKVAFAAPLVLGTRQGGVEPSIAVGPDGTVYVTTPNSPGMVWRSDDGGRSYKAVGSPYCPRGLPTCPGLEQYEAGNKGGGDADLWVTPDGRVHWLGLADGSNAIPYQRSDDRGVTWSDVQDLAGDDSADREWITSRADGTLFAAWRNFPPSDSGRDAMIVMRSSHDGGTTWTPVTNISKDTRQGGIAVDPSSNALALAHDLGGKVGVAHSFDNGTTWTDVAVVDDPVLGHVFPVTAYDAAGTLYLAYAHDKDGAPIPATPALDPRPFETPALYLHVSHDKGLTWSGPVQVNAPGTTAWFPWIAAGSAGRVVLAWYQIDSGKPRQLADDVYVEAAISLDADQAKPSFTLSRVTPEPVHQGPECRENPVVCTRSLLDFFEVAIHPDGYPVLAFAKDTYPVPVVSVVTSYMVKGPNLLG